MCLISTAANWLRAFGVLMIPAEMLCRPVDLNAQPLSFSCGEHLAYCKVSNADNTNVNNRFMLLDVKEPLMRSPTTVTPK